MKSQLHYILLTLGSCRVNKAPAVPTLPVYRDVELADEDNAPPPQTTIAMKGKARAKAHPFTREATEQPISGAGPTSEPKAEGTRDQNKTAITRLVHNGLSESYSVIVNERF